MNETVAVTVHPASSGEVEFRNYRAGMVFIPSGSDITYLIFYVAPKAGGTYLPLQCAAAGQSSSSSSSSGDEGVDIGAGTLVLSVAAGYAYQLPGALAGCRAFKMVGDAAGSVDVSFQE